MVFLNILNGSYGVLGVCKVLFINQSVQKIHWPCGSHNHQYSFVVEIVVVAEKHEH